MTEYHHLLPYDYQLQLENQRIHLLLRELELEVDNTLTGSAIITNLQWFRTIRRGN